MVAKTLSVGDGTSSAHGISFNIGGSNPLLRWNTTTSQIDISNDGTAFSSLSGAISSASKTVYNNSVGTLTAGTLVFLSAWNSGQSLYEIAKAVVTTSNATTLYAQWIVDADILTAASGTVVTAKIRTAQDTSTGTAGRPVFLSTTAGTWTDTLPVVENRIQIVGYINTVHATTGRLELFPSHVIPWSIADQI